MNNLDSTIEKAIRNHESEVKLLTHVTDDDVYRSVRNVMRNNPDIFWFSHQWDYKEKEHKVYFRYAIDKKRCEKTARQIDDVVRNDFKLDDVRTLSVREQVMYVYKWIALYCNYDIHSAHNQTIYSVFVLRNSVCTGIAKAAQYLLKLLGIESRLVFGKMNNSEKDSRHCWLIVHVEGRWYHLDPTFALSETEQLLNQCGVKPLQGDDFLFYNFFCVDTATITLSRTIEEEELLPLCYERIDYTLLQQINVTPSRNGETAGLGCLLSDIGTTADIYLAHSADKYERHRTVAKVFKDDPDHELLHKELIVMRECAGPHLLRAQNADFATTCVPYSPNSSSPFQSKGPQSRLSETYFPCGNNNQSIPQNHGKECASPAPQSSKGIFGKIRNLIFGQTDNHTPAEVNDRTPLAEKVNSSIFAPSETKRGDYMMVQVFLYKDDEERIVARKAAEVDPDARRQNFTPLSVKLLNVSKHWHRPIHRLIWRKLLSQFIR